MVGKGREEDQYLLIGGNWWLPKQLQTVKEANGKFELCKVDMQWHGLGVAQIMAEVVCKTVTSTDAVGDNGS